MPSTATSILDGLSTSVAVKAPVKAASTASLTLSGEQTIDGVACVEGDRVLVKDQSTASENGIYVVSTGSWTRAKDFDGNRDVRQGTLVILGVTGSSGIYYRVTSSNPIVIGTSAINFEIVGGTLTQAIIGNLLFPYDGEIIAGTEPTTATARFYAVEAIDAHAHYGFLDESQIEYAGGAPIYGHASFDDNVTFTGSVASDHHHSFQSYPHYDNSGTIGRIAGFYSIGDVTDGTVTAYAGLYVDDPTGTGTITNLYGVYVNELDRGSGNSYAFFSEGQTKSCLGGDLQLGNPVTPATIKYDYNSGNLELVPRTGGYKTHVRSELLIGTGDEAQTASIENTGSGDLEITARTGFVTKMKSPTQVEHPMKLPAYTVAALTSSVLPGDWTDCICICSNEAGGRTLVFSDGTNWKRAQDLANIS
jgi:hypothetical protein